MARYVVFYEMRKGNASASSNKTVECEDERTAVMAAEQQGKAQRPDYTFVLKKVEKRS
ncbi:hypothetical protein [Variovorax sp. W2I14]|uniref:hypothetical protein n=1 Tax=Variovorax sp. W2I14 TaxID=3042290 RepID=UPI003D21E31B